MPKGRDFGQHSGVHVSKGAPFLQMNGSNITKMESPYDEESVGVDEGLV